MRDLQVWAVLLAVQYVLFVRVVRPWLMRCIRLFGELSVLLRDLTPPTR